MRRLTKEEVRAAIHDGRAAGWEFRPRLPLNSYAQAALEAHLAGDLPERRRARILDNVWLLAYRKARDLRVAELEQQLALSLGPGLGMGVDGTAKRPILHSWVTSDGKIYERDWNLE